MTADDMTKESLELQTIRSLAGNRPTRIVQPGEVIFQAGETGDSMYGVVRGEVRLDWDQQPLHETIQPGSCFGIGALVDTNHCRYGTAIAVTETELLEMNREEFLLAVQELPMFGLEMLHDLDERLRRIKSGLPG